MDPSPPSYVIVQTPHGFEQIKELYFLEKQKIVAQYDKEAEILRNQYEATMNDIQRRRDKAEQAFDAEILVRLHTKSSRSWNWFWTLLGL